MWGYTVKIEKCEIQLYNLARKYGWSKKIENVSLISKTNVGYVSYKNSFDDKIIVIRELKKCKIARICIFLKMEV